MLGDTKFYRYIKDRENDNDRGRELPTSDPPLYPVGRLYHRSIWSIFVGFGLAYFTIFASSTRAQPGPDSQQPNPIPEASPKEADEPMADEKAATAASPSATRERAEPSVSIDEADETNITTTTSAATEQTEPATTEPVVSEPITSEPIAIEETKENDSDEVTSLEPRVSGALVASGRATFYDKDEYYNEQYEKDWPLDEEYTLQLEQTLLRLSGNLSEAFSWEIMPCLTHLEDFSVVTAFFNYEIHSLFQIKAGRFLLPFGQFNLRSLPGEYKTVSRPYLYRGHEDREFRFKEGVPSSFIMTPRDDVGLLLWGNSRFGSKDLYEVSYYAYLTNGLRKFSNTAQRHWDDNNNGKQLGGRLVFGLNSEGVKAAVGGSLLSNVYEDDEYNNKGLKQRAFAVDGVISIAYLTDRWINLRGEFVDMLREVVPTVDLAQGDEGLQGFYLTADLDLFDFLNVYYQIDWLTERTPVLDRDSGEDDSEEEVRFHDEKYKIIRQTVGVSVTPFDSFAVRIEYGRWVMSEADSNAHRASIQTILTF